MLDHALYAALAEVQRKVWTGPVAGPRRFTFPRVVELILAHLRAESGATLAEECRRIFAARGLTEPSYVVPLELGEWRGLWLPGLDDLREVGLDALNAAPSAIQLRMNVPAGAQRLAVEVACDDDAREIEVSGLILHARFECPVHYNLSGQAVNVETEVRKEFSGRRVEMAGAELARLRGRDIYLSLASMATEAMDLDVRVTIEMAESASDGAAAADTIRRSERVGRRAGLVTPVTTSTGPIGCTAS